MHPGPLFAWGTAAGRPVRPPGRGGNPPPTPLEGAVAPGGLPGTPDRAFQASDEGGTGAAYPARAQVARQFDRAVADAPQADYLETLRAPQPAHLAVASLVQHDPESAVAGPGTLLVQAFSADPIEARRTVVQLHARKEPAQDLRPRPAAQAHQVLALHFARGVHEAVGELPIRRQQQQPRGVHVQPPDRNPAAVARWRQALEHGRQALEHGRPALRVAAGGHLADGLVIK